jgi:hypothetical protein
MFMLKSLKQRIEKEEERKRILCTTSSRTYIDFSWKWTKEKIAWQLPAKEKQESEMDRKSEKLYRGGVEENFCRRLAVTNLAPIVLIRFFILSCFVSPCELTVFFCKHIIRHGDGILLPLYLSDPFYAISVHQFMTICDIVDMIIIIKYNSFRPYSLDILVFDICMCLWFLCVANFFHFPHTSFKFDLSCELCLTCTQCCVSSRKRNTKEWGKWTFTSVDCLTKFYVVEEETVESLNVKFFIHSLEY